MYTSYSISDEKKQLLVKALHVYAASFSMGDPELDAALTLQQQVLAADAVMLVSDVPDTVDDAIRKARKLIEKYQHLKVIDHTD